MRYLFADCDLDTRLYSLRRAGQSLALRPKVFQVLLYLLEHRERVVTKQELLDAVWPQQFISDATLADCIRTIRRAVGETRASQHVIQTRHGHGYRLVAAVEVIASESPTPADAPPSPPAALPVAPHLDRPASAAPPLIATLLAALQLPPATGPSAERRQITILSCALVGAPGLGAHLDPEAWYAVVQTWQETCAEVIAPWEGHIVHYLGDGVLAYFGYPLAHEDDARRAVLAGLDLLTAIEPLRVRLGQLPEPTLAVRLGIHTGMVITSRQGMRLRPEQLTTGATPQIALGIQALAASNTLLISDTTARLVQGYVVCQEAGQYELQGLETPMPLWHVAGRTEALDRLQRTGRERFTPLVGRETEMALLHERWRQVHEGEGQVVLLSGEAGIGKSRLADAVRAHVASEGAPQVIWRCSPYHTHSALFPVLTYLQQLARFEPAEAPVTKLAKLEGLLTGYRLGLEQTVPLFAALLEVPLGQRYPPVQLPPEQLKHQTYEALVALFLEAAERQPLFLLCEDLHWADPSTLELLTLLLSQVPMLRALVLLLFRPDFRPPWSPHAHCVQLSLPRFRRAQVEQMLAVLANGTPLPADLHEQVIARTDGVPLFVEELVNTLRESLQAPGPAAPGQPVTVPTSLQDALMARLDRLGSARDLAQLGATWGREFTYAQMQYLVAPEDATFQQHLVQLVEADILHQRGFPPQASYRFKHALIQETAYQSLLRRTRHAYHGQIAQVLAAHFPETMATQPELLAHHYTEAERFADAIPYWQQAGERAIRHSAYLEAVSHLRQGLTLLKTVPETPARQHQELALNVALGPALSALQGYATAEVEVIYTRAYVLCHEVGETAQLFPTLWGLLRFYMGQGLFAQAREIAEQLVREAERTMDPHRRIEAYDALVAVCSFLGECATALPYLERGLALIDPATERTLALRQGLAPGVRCLAVSANMLGFLGFPTQAVQRGQEALALAEEVGHPYSVAVAHNWVTYVYRRRREVAAVLALAESLLTLAKAQGFTLYIGLGTCWRGWAQALLGAGEAGLAELRQGMATVLEAGQTMARPLCLVLQAEAAGHLGQAADGLALLDDALSDLEVSGRGDLLAEVYHLQGTLLLRQDVRHGAQAEACLQQALAVARRQEAKALELQAARSLCHLWQSQGKREGARQLLAEIYGWFREGFETTDLQEAKALLAALA